MAFDVEMAKKSGYSDSEIADYLSQQGKFDARGARENGYSDAEILAHLTGSPESSPPANGFVKGLGYGAKRTAGLVKNALNDATTAVFDNPVGRSIDRAGQAIGLDSMYDVAAQNKQALEVSKEQAPKGFAGQAGNVLGSVGVAAPTMLIPGANSWLGAGLIGAGTGAVLSEGGSANKRLEDAGAGAAGGLIGRAAAPVLSNAVRGARDSVKTLFGSSTREPTMAKAAEALSQKASALYDQAEAAGVKFKQQAVRALAGDMRKALSGVNPYGSPKTAGLMQWLDEMADGGDVPLERLDQFRQVLGKSLRSADAQDAHWMQEMKGRLDDFADKIPPNQVTGDHTNGVQLLKDARKAWSMKSKAQALDDIYGAAELNASGQTNNQALGTIINGFKALAKDQRKMRAFTPEEQQQIRSIVMGGPGERVLRLIGRFSPTGPVSGGVSGAAVAGLGPIGLAVPVAGIAAKGAATRATQRNINTLEDMIMQGQSVPGTRLSAQPQLPSRTPHQDVLARVLQTAGIVMPNVNQ